jgi:hypothetical protein
VHLRGLVTAALGLLVLASLTRPALASPAIEACLEQADRAFVGDELRGTFRPSPLARYDRVMADARGVEWRPRRPRRASASPRYAVAFAGSHNCWIGGEIVGIADPSPSAPSGIAIGTGYRTTDTEVHSLEISNTQDGIRVGPDTIDLRLTNVLVADATGTCLIAGHQGDLVVDHAFFHRCARAVKLDTRYAGSTLTVRNSLIRIDNRRGVRSRGRLFTGRTLGSSVRVQFDDNIVVTAQRLDRRSLSVIEPSCASNTLIWVGEGDYPGRLPDCFEVIDGQRAWREARRAWREQHARQLAALGDVAPPPSACATPEVPEALRPRKTVGDGSGASCSESALRRALAGGGAITFACGAAPVTIALESELVIASPTVLDGGGRVTLDGRNRTRIIRNTSELTLKAMRLTRGRANVVWNGSPDGGGAVHTTYGRRLYVVDSSFTDNATSVQGFGGAIFRRRRRADGAGLALRAQRRRWRRCHLQPARGAARGRFRLPAQPGLERLAGRRRHHDRRGQRQQRQRRLRRRDRRLRQHLRCQPGPRDRRRRVSLRLSQGPGDRGAFGLRRESRHPQ